MEFKMLVIAFLLGCVLQIQSNEPEPQQFLVKAARNSQVGRLGAPKCRCAHLNCSCCFQAILLKAPPVCVKANYSVNELTMSLDVEVDGKRVGGNSIGPQAVPFCIPAVPLYMCLSANRVFFSSNETTACFTYTIKFVVATELYTGNFPCFHYENGKFGLSSNRVQ